MPAPDADSDEALRNAANALVALNAQLSVPVGGGKKARKAQRLLARQADEIAKAVGQNYARAQARVMEAEEQGSHVNRSFDLYGLYDHRNIREKTLVTFETLRRFADRCPPATAITETIKDYVARFAQPALIEEGQVKQLGFKIRLTDRDTEAGPSDREEIKRLTQFFAEAGFCEPPESQRSDNWQPGLPAFVKMLIGDANVLNWACVRTWASRTAPDRYPVVAFEAVDAARIRRTRRPEAGVRRDGTPITEDWRGERANAHEQIRFVRFAVESDLIIEELTGAEMCAWVPEPRTDTRANGYGYGWLERSIDLMTDFLHGKQYNSQRFVRDKLPRGFLTILANVGETQMRAFQLQWREMMQDNRWGIPVLQALATGPGSSSRVAEWTPLDLSTRDMEYPSWMHFIALWLHANARLSMEDTGYSEMSQTRPPLSEASPDVKLKASRNKVLDSTLESLAAFLNRSILWRLVPDRRFTLDFVGNEESDATADEDLVTKKLANGTTTPRMIWNARDLKIPEALAAHPAWDFPMPFAEGVQMLQSMQGAQQNEDEAQAERDLQDAMTEQSGGLTEEELPDGALSPDAAGSAAAGGLPMGKEAAAEDTDRGGDGARPSAPRTGKRLRVSRGASSVAGAAGQSHNGNGTGRR